MNEQLIVDTWTLFKDHLDKKNLPAVAEQFVELCADYGVDDQTLKTVLGNCPYLDHAIAYYLDEPDLEYDE